MFVAKSAVFEKPSQEVVDAAVSSSIGQSVIPASDKYDVHNMLVVYIVWVHI